MALSAGARGQSPAVCVKAISEVEATRDRQQGFSSGYQTATDQDINRWIRDLGGCLSNNGRSHARAGEAYKYRGELYQYRDQAGDKRRAVSDFEAALRVASWTDDGLYFFKRMHPLYEKLEDHRKVIRTIDSIFQKSVKSREDAFLHFDRAEAAEALQQFESAAQSYERSAVLWNAKAETDDPSFAVAAGLRLMRRRGGVKDCDFLADDRNDFRLVFSATPAEYNSCLANRRLHPADRIRVQRARFWNLLDEKRNTEANEVAQAIWTTRPALPYLRQIDIDHYRFSGTRYGNSPAVHRLKQAIQEGFTSDLAGRVDGLSRLFAAHLRKILREKKGYFYSDYRWLEDEDNIDFLSFTSFFEPVLNTLIATKKYAEGAKLVDAIIDRPLPENYVLGLRFRYAELTAYSGDLKGGIASLSGLEPTLEAMGQNGSRGLLRLWEQRARMNAAQDRTDLALADIDKIFAAFEGDWVQSRQAEQLHDLGVLRARLAISGGVQEKANLYIRDLERLYERAQIPCEVCISLRTLQAQPR